MASHTTETQRTRQTVLAPRTDKSATTTSVWFPFFGPQAQSNDHSQGLVTQSHDATGSDRKRVKPVSGVLSCNGPPSGLEHGPGEGVGILAKVVPHTEHDKVHFVCFSPA